MMKKLLNTLYVLSEDLYLALDNENVAAKREGEIVGRVPLHTLTAIISFSYLGASPALMGECAERGIALSFFNPRGKFLADVHGERYGNVSLRRLQHKMTSDREKSVPIARNFILGKAYNSKWVLERARRDHGLRIDCDSVELACSKMANSLERIRVCEDLDSLRGIEGDAAAEYFSVFDELILRNKEAFFYRGRSRRPPCDRVNAMLSLFYSVLARDCSYALEGVGLDPYFGFLHVDRPGRRSLALDLMEELRPVFVDRFVITAINNQIVSEHSFEELPTGETYLSEKGRRALFDSWQERKRSMITHPFLKEKIPRGLVPHIQAQLLAKAMRGEIDGYPPFLWK